MTIKITSIRRLDLVFGRMTPYEETVEELFGKGNAAATFSSQASMLGGMQWSGQLNMADGSMNAGLGAIAGGLDADSTISSALEALGSLEVEESSSYAIDAVVEALAGLLTALEGNAIVTGQATVNGTLQASLSAATTVSSLLAAVQRLGAAISAGASIAGTVDGSGSITVGSEGEALLLDIRGLAESLQVSLSALASYSEARTVNDGLVAQATLSMVQSALLAAIGSLLASSSSTGVQAGRLGMSGALNTGMQSNSGIVVRGVLIHQIIRALLDTLQATLATGETLTVPEATGEALKQTEATGETLIDSN